MFAIAMRWAFRLAGPAMAAAAPYLPAPAVFKTVARLILVLVALTFGGFAGWVMHSWGEPERLERARVDAVEKARLRDKANAQDLAIGRQAETLRFREQQLNAAEQELEQLRDEKERLRAQSKDPGGAVLPGDDPWLLAKRARRAGARGVDVNH